MHSKYKVVLFDVDGVLLLPPKLFSVQYCEKYGVDAELQEQFYRTKEFKDSLLGKFDLKEAIRLHDDKWQWQGDIDDLLQMWFMGEDYPNEPLLDVVKQLRAAGTKVFLATQQEQYRKSHLRDVTFKDKIDGIFCSCDIGYGKDEDHFWEAVLHEIKNMNPRIEPAGIAYYDDRQSLVELARRHGVTAFLYENVDKVQKEALSLVAKK